MPSDFIKEAYRRGNVKKYSEVKNADPNLLENDCPSFYIGEKINSYTNYEIGDIVFVGNFNYEDNSKGNNHLFVIVDEDNHAVPINYFCMILSSNLKKITYRQNILLKKDYMNKLKKDSIVKTDYIYEFTNEDINMFIGKVPLEKVNEFKELYLKGSKYE